MTIYYCIKSTREIIGTHKAWLALRDSDPARYEALRNSKDLELVRIGYHMRDSMQKIAMYPYALMEKHIELCHSHMQHALKTIQAEIDALETDLQLVASSHGRDLISAELSRLKECAEIWARDIKRGALRLSSVGNYD